jgi:hypothetical protein
MNERIEAFRWARYWHHWYGHPRTLRGCNRVMCQIRVERLRAGLRPWSITPPTTGQRTLERAPR